MKDVHLCDFIMETEENPDLVHCKVEKMLAITSWMTTTFPLEEVMGSSCGTCMCGFPRMMGVPCMHMVAALKSGSVEGLNENNFTPSWWMISQMCLQYPVNVEIKADMDIASLMLDGVTNHHIGYCPSMVTPRKAGRPKGKGRIKGPLEKRSKKSMI